MFVTRNMCETCQTANNSANLASGCGEREGEEVVANNLLVIELDELLAVRFFSTTSYGVP